MGLAGAEPARLGYRYEDWAILSYLAEVIAREATVQFEGPIPSWTEAHVLRSDGSTETVQCKSRAEDRWTIRRLKSEGVLDGLVGAADQGSAFRFVSDQRCELEKVAEDTAVADGDDDRWLTDVVKNRGHAVVVEKLAAATGREVRQVRSLLRRATFEIVGRAAAERLGRLSLERYIRAAVRNDVINALLVGLSERRALLGRRITSDVINDYLAREGIHDWRSMSRADVASQLTMLNASFLATRRPDSAMPRPEANKVAEMVLGGDALVGVQAPGGFGKSVVLAQVIELLGEEGYTIAAIDARTLPDGVAQLGNYFSGIGLPDGLIEGLSLNERRVLVIDQLDSVAPALGGSHQRWTLVKHLIERARVAQVQVVVGCRPVNGLPALVAEGERATRVVLDEWTPEEMALLLGNGRPLPAGIPCIPVFGALWAEIEGDERLPATAATLLLRHREDIRRRADVSADEMTAVEGLVTAALERSGNAVCALSQLAGHSETVDRLVAVGYLQQSGNGAVFRQEVVGEHAWASAFDRRGSDVCELLQVDGFHVHRRLLNLFDFLAHSGPDRQGHLVRFLRAAVAPEIRPARAATALFWMSSCDRAVAHAMWPVLRDAIESNAPWRRRVGVRVLHDNCHFFDQAFDTGTLEELASDDEGKDSVVGIAATACPEHDERVASLANAVLGLEVLWRNDAARYWIHLAIRRPRDEIIDAWTRSLGLSDDPTSLMIDQYALGELASRSATSAARVLASWLGRHRQLAIAAGMTSPFDWRYESLLRHTDHVAPDALAKSQPEAFADLCGDEIVECCRALSHGLGSIPMAGIGLEIQDDVGLWPTTIGAGFVRGLAHALSTSAPAAERFLAVHGLDPDESAAAFCAVAQIRRDDPWTATTWLEQLASADVVLTPSSKDPVLLLVTHLVEREPGTGLRLHERIGRWAEREGLLDAGAPGRVMPAPAPITITGELIQRPTDDADVAQWTDDQWRRAAEVTDDVEGRAAQLRDRAKAEPERFVSFLINTTAPLPGSYIAAILDGAKGSENPIKVDVAQVADTVHRLAPDGTHTLGVVGLVWRSMEQSPTVAERDLVARLAEAQDPTQHLREDQDDRSKVADWAWLHRLDTLAASAMGRWVNENPDDIVLLDPIIERAVTDADATLGAALVDGLLRASLQRELEADRRVLRLLDAIPAIAESPAFDRYTRQAWRLGRPSLPEYWESRASNGLGSATAGSRWAFNRVRSGCPPTLEDVDDLPTATQVGVAETAAELARYPDHHSWARPLLARLLEHESEDIHTMASRWTYTVTQPDQQSDVAGDRTPIPARFLELIPATVRRMTKLMDAYPLLLALAGGTATQARNACRVTAELLPGSLPSSDLAFGWDVTRCAQIAQAAYETLDNEAVDPSPAMDLLDQLVGHNPCALMGDLLARR